MTVRTIQQVTSTRRQVTILAALLILVASPLPSFGQQPFQRGDANDDGAVDLADAVTTLGSLFVGEASVRCADAADANDDGFVDVSDVMRTLTHLFLGGPPAPPPLTCGADPTSDQLGCARFDGCAGTTESELAPELAALLASAADGRVPARELRQIFELSAPSPRGALVAVERLRDVDPSLEVTWRQDADAPSFVTGYLRQPDRRAPSAIATDFLAENPELFGMRKPSVDVHPDHETSHTDAQTEYTEVRFEQVVAGHPVIGGRISVNVAVDGSVRAVHGRFERGINPRVIPKEAAIDKAALAAIIRLDLGLPVAPQ